MSKDRVRPVICIALTAAIACGVAGSVVRAATCTPDFDKRRDELFRQATDAQKQQGLDRVSVFAKYPCAEIALDKITDVPPGGSAPISMRGKFADNTTFLSEHDGAQLSGVTVAKGALTARVTVLPDVFPKFVRIAAITPLSGGYNAAPMIFINGVYAFDLRGDNGWTVKAVPTAKAFTRSANDATLPYRVEFYRPNEAKPFETLLSDVRISINDAACSTLNFNMRETAGAAQAEFEALSQKMGDPQFFLKMSEAEQDKFMDRLGTLQEQMLNEMMAALKDPAAMQKKQDNFGCSGLYVSAVPGGKVTAMLRCGNNVGKSGIVNATGTLTAIR